MSKADAVLRAFSSADAQATPWGSAFAILEAAELFCLSTVRPDGRPYVTPLLAVWSLDGMCFTTGPQERKAHNLDRNPRCVLTTLYRVEPTVGFAFGKLPTSSQTRYTWPSR